MKCKNFLGNLAVLLAVFALVFAGCDDPNNANDDDPDSGPSSLASYRLTATTSHPQAHVFAQSADENDWIEITVANVITSLSGNFNVDYQITNFFEEVVKEGSLAFTHSAGATQNKRITLDKSELGYFTVRASIENGPSRITLPTGAGTRPRYWINYAVVPDPLARRMNTAPNVNNKNIQPGVDQSVYFGMAIIPGGGGTSPQFDNVFNPVAWLGIDATISGQLQWTNNFWDAANQRTNVAQLEHYANGGTVPDWYNGGVLVDATSTLKMAPHIIQEMAAYMPTTGVRTVDGMNGTYGGQLSVDGEEEFRKYCEGVAMIHIAQAPFRPRHYYQILWEPVGWWNGWLPRDDASGNNPSLVRAYEVAYKAIHGVYDKRALGELTLPDGTTPAADAAWRERAVILGPTSSDAATIPKSLDWHRGKFEGGLANWIDGLSVHPYNDIKHAAHESGPENGFAEFIRSVIALTKEWYSQRDNPTYFDEPFFWGTEQGLAEFTNGPLRTGQVLARQNLIMKGEGFHANHNFCFTDYNTNQKYGFFYNCTAMSQPLEVYGAQYISPKHAVSSFAALTLLMKGYETLGRIDDLCGPTLAGNGTRWGYKYEDKWNMASNAVMYALWDFGEGVTSDYTFNVTDSGPITVYNVVGTDITDTVLIEGRNVTLKLSENVLYVHVGTSVN